MSVYHKPRFVGRTIDSDSRFDHFMNYVTNYELSSDFASIYRQSFESQVNNYIKQASTSRDNLLSLENKLRSVKKKENLSASGLIAQQDAMAYVLDGLIYSREAVLERISVHG